MINRKQVLVSCIFAIEHVLKDDGQFDVEHILAVQAMIALEPTIPSWAPATEGGKVLNCQGVNAPPSTWPHYAVTITRAVTESWRLDGSPRGKFYRFVLCTMRDAVRAEIERIRAVEAKARREEEDARQKAERDSRHEQIAAENAALAKKHAEDAKKREAEEAKLAAVRKAKREEEKKRTDALMGLMDAAKTNNAAPVAVAPPTPKTSEERRLPRMFTEEKITELIKRAPSEKKNPVRIAEWIARVIREDERYTSARRAALLDFMKIELTVMFVADGGGDLADAERRAAKLFAVETPKTRKPEPEKGAPVYNRPAQQQRTPKPKAKTETFSNFSEAARAFERHATEAATAEQTVPPVDPVKEIEKFAAEIGADLANSEDRNIAEKLLRERLDANRPKGLCACECTDDRPSVEECLAVVRETLEKSDAPAAMARTFIQAVRLSGRPNREVSTIETGANKALAHLMRLQASQNFSADFHAGAMSSKATEEAKKAKKNKSKEKGRKGADARAA